MFTHPELTTGTNATAALPRRLDARRDGYVERTVITSGGVRLAVRDYGSAGAREHTVVLLHGLCLTQSSWALQIRHLVRRWGNSVRIITYDHRGHGRSTGADMHTYRIDRLAADLADVLTALRVTEPLTLAGTLDGRYDGAGIPGPSRRRSSGGRARPRRCEPVTCQRQSAPFRKKGADSCTASMGVRVEVSYEIFASEASRRRMSAAGSAVACR